MPGRYLTFGALAFLVLLMAIYGNSLDTSWHFDDFQNIVENKRLHIMEWSWPAIVQIAHGPYGEKILRPVAYLSFAMNHTMGGLDIVPYHLTNLLIHYITTLILFVLIYRTLNLPLLAGCYGEKSYGIALLASVLWAINPVQVSAVTYIVQRMTSMAAMFYLLAMYFYVSARMEGRRGRKIIKFVFSGCAALASLGTKENAVMLPLSLFAYDLILIQGATREHVRRYIKLFCIPVLLILVVIISTVDFARLVNDYNSRPFTPLERLLTEPRVILFYATLLLYPITSRLTLLHEVELSVSFFEPWTTLPVLVLLLLAAGYAVYKSRKNPLLSFCILFFLINHLIEGSFIPLEIIYEHRNYLPSLFFFLPVAVLIVKTLDRFKEKQSVYILLAVVCTGVFIIEGVTVFLQNEIWRNEQTLWADNVAKSPGLHRPRHNLGVSLLAAGHFPEGVRELEMALKGRNEAAINQKYVTHYQLGRYYFFVKNYDQAFYHFRQTLAWAPLYPDPYHYLARIMCVLARHEEAESLIHHAMSLNRSADYSVTYGLIRLKRGDPEGAIAAAHKALRMNQGYKKSYSLLAQAHLARREYRSAAHFETLSAGEKVSCEQLP